MTSWLHGALSWREIFLAYAGLNAFVCFPVHLLLGRLTSRAVSDARDEPRSLKSDAPRPSNGTLVFLLMLVGFAVEGYALSAILVHMVPLTQALGLGAAGLLVAALFGPAQVTSRLINLVFGRDLSQMWLAVIAAMLLPIGLAILLATAPWMAGAVLFAICVGLGSGLTSIVGGTLPLELFGSGGISPPNWLVHIGQAVDGGARAGRDVGFDVRDRGRLVAVAGRRGRGDQRT